MYADFGNHLSFLIIGIIAALFGFGNVAGTSIYAAKILFFVFIVLAIIAFLAGGSLFHAR